MLSSKSKTNMTFEQNFIVSLSYQKILEICFTTCIPILRMPAIHEAIIFNTQPIKNLRDNVLTKGPYVTKVKSDLRSTPWAEVKNDGCCRIYIFNFSSATRECFSNLTSLLSSMDPLLKIVPRIFERWVINRNIERNVKDKCILGFMYSMYP